MPIQVVNGALLVCPFGMMPSTLVVTPEKRVLSSSQPAATIMDFVPLENIPSFGLCTSILNPEVEAATIAAFGVLTPMPCLPVTTSPWLPGGPVVLLEGMPALTEGSICLCDWMGVIEIDEPGQETNSTDS